MSETNVNAVNNLDLLILLPNTKKIDASVPSDMTPKEMVLSFMNGEYGEEFKFDAQLSNIRVTLKGSTGANLDMDRTFADNGLHNNDSIQIFADTRA